MTLAGFGVICIVLIAQMSDVLILKALIRYVQPLNVTEEIICQAWLIALLWMELEEICVFM